MAYIFSVVKYIDCPRILFLHVISSQQSAFLGKSNAQSMVCDKRIYMNITTGTTMSPYGHCVHVIHNVTPFSFHLFTSVYLTPLDRASDDFYHENTLHTKLIKLTALNLHSSTQHFGVI